MRKLYKKLKTQKLIISKNIDFFLELLQICGCVCKCVFVLGVWKNSDKLIFSRFFNTLLGLREFQHLVNV